MPKLKDGRFYSGQWSTCDYCDDLVNFAEYWGLKLNPESHNDAVHMADVLKEKEESEKENDG